MLLRKDSTSRSLSAVLMSVLIVGSRSFPAPEFPTEIETVEDNSDTRPPTVNTPEESAAKQTSSEEPRRIALREQPIPQVLKFDYYDYQQLPNDPDDEMPALPDHVVNVNEDYAGIYDYRGSRDGRFRRKRTLTTNVEQLLTRSSRIRSKRSVSENSFDESAVGSPAEQAENLVTLLSAMQDSDPEFDASEFLKVLDAQSVSEQDLEYLLLLSTLASQKDAAIPEEFRDFPRNRLRLAAARAWEHPRKNENDPFRSSPLVVMDDGERDQILAEEMERAKVPQRNGAPRIYAISSLHSARGPSAGIAM
ncbi:uncharacterized protein LOC100900756 [Galendromus occidentalis]|uniref:Uncharacterized protein LOC100900756 n=1 Tax=Galendromus occidentalis TaxID=34638 RepID=A0AAJ7PBD7_9ACAR|nr:uncharacterized protein LOC100900756 [Galendromus occidentalis]